MPIRGRIAVDDQGRLVMIDPSADRDAIDAADIQPLSVDDLNLSGQLTGDSGRTVYDDATETVGDGQTSADHESVSTGFYTSDVSGPGVGYEMDSVTLSDGDTHSITNNFESTQGLLTISRPLGSAFAIVGILGTADSVSEIHLGDSFTTTQGNSGSVNIYYDSGYVVQNLEGGDRRIDLLYWNARD